MRHAIAKIIAILNASRKGETSRSLKNDLFQIHCFTGKRQKRYILDERVVWSRKKRSAKRNFEIYNEHLKSKVFSLV